jgi:hypothetical protein
MPKIAKKENKNMCCKHCFPCGSGLILIAGILWLLQDLNVLSWNVPWLPIVVILISLKMIIVGKHMHRHMMEKK